MLHQAGRAYIRKTSPSSFFLRRSPSVAASRLAVAVAVGAVSTVPHCISHSPLVSSRLARPLAHFHPSFFSLLFRSSAKPTHHLSSLGRRHTSARGPASPPAPLHKGTRCWSPPHREARNAHEVGGAPRHAQTRVGHPLALRLGDEAVPWSEEPPRASPAKGLGQQQ